MKKLNKKGFSAVELIVVVIVISAVVGAFFVARSRMKNSEAESSKLYSVHIVAGQSNAVGWGSNPSQMESNPIDEKIKFYYSHETTSGGKITRMKSQSIPWGKHKAGFGPEVRLGRQLYRKGYQNVYIIKVGKGGTSLKDDWKANKGPLYKKYINEEINRALNELKRQGHRYSIDGFYWMQGEADMTKEAAGSYEANLREFISAVRTRLNRNNLKVIVGRANHPSAPEPYRTTVRRAQVKVAETTPNVLWVNTDDIKLADFVHYDSEGELILGQRFANNIFNYMEKTYPNGLK